MRIVTELCVIADATEEAPSVSRGPFRRTCCPHCEQSSMESHARFSHRHHSEAQRSLAASCPEVQTKYNGLPLSLQTCPRTICVTHNPAERCRFARLRIRNAAFGHAARRPPCQRANAPASPSALTDVADMHDTAVVVTSRQEEPAADGSALPEAVTCGSLRSD